MFLKLCQAALQLSDRSAVSNALSLDLCCCRLCSRLSWLWQCDTGWSEWTVDGATSVCFARRCAADLLQVEVRAHNATAHVTALRGCLHLSAFSSNLRCSFSVVSMVLLPVRHTLLTSCSRWQPWSHPEGHILGLGQTGHPEGATDYDGRQCILSRWSSRHVACGTVCRHGRRMHLRCLYLGGCWNANFSVAVTAPICANWYTVFAVRCYA